MRLGFIRSLLARAQVEARRRENSRSDDNTGMRMKLDIYSTQAADYYNPILYYIDGIFTFLGREECVKTGCSARLLRILESLQVAMRHLTNSCESFAPHFGASSNRGGFHSRTSPSSRGCIGTSPEQWTYSDSTSCSWLPSVS